MTQHQRERQTTSAIEGGAPVAAQTRPWRPAHSDDCAGRGYRDRPVYGGGKKYCRDGDVVPRHQYAGRIFTCMMGL